MHLKLNSNIASKIGRVAIIQLKKKRESMQYNFCSFFGKNPDDVVRS